MKKLNKKQQKIIILIGIFISVFILNYLFPLANDDYTYSFGLNGRVKNLLDIIKFQYHHYMTWGGRSLAHTIAQIFLMYPKMLFNVCNSVMYTLLIYLIYKLVITKKEKPSYLLIIYLTLWFVFPVFGQTSLWLTGSCNYTWTTTIILYFLLKYKNYKNIKDKKLNILLMLLLGIIAGWTNENTSFGSITIIISTLIIQKYFNKEKLKKWQLSGLLGNLIGFIIMILAPGNFNRKEEFIENPNIIIRLTKRVIVLTRDLITYCLPLFIAIIIIFTLIKYYKKKIDNRAYVYLIGAFLATYSMAMSPIIPARIYTGVIVFFLISILILYDKINKEKIIPYVSIIFIGIISVLFVKDYLYVFEDLYRLNIDYKGRIEYIKEEKAKGNLELKLYPFSSESTKNPFYHSPDLQKDKNAWPNYKIAKYYGIKSIEGIYE